MCVLKLKSAKQFYFILKILFIRTYLVIHFLLTVLLLSSLLLGQCVTLVLFLYCFLLVVYHIETPSCIGAVTSDLSFYCVRVPASVRLTRFTDEHIFKHQD